MRVFRSISVTAFATVVTIASVLPLTDAAALEDNCKITPERTDAFSAPSRHAWNLFLTLNHPAREGAFVRGEPDCTKPLGAPGATAVWESWRLAATEVFLADGSEPPEWNDRSLPSGGTGSTPTNRDSIHDIRSISASFHEEDGVFVDRGGIGESRMNRSTYEFIKDNCLWSRDGLDRYAAAVIAGKKPHIDLPTDSIEVKAVWLEFGADSLPRGDPDRYYTAEHDGKLYGLTSFHILTKDVPKWFWATFHHKDAPENQYEREDDYGPPPAVKGTVWENYILGGTQIDFVNAVGHPITLSDHYIEFDFQNSSCITCHSQASNSPPGVPPRQTTDVGTPDPRPYFTDDTMTTFRVIPTDFLWSIPFRARAEVGTPPDRCIW